MVKRVGMRATTILVTFCLPVFGAEPEAAIDELKRVPPLSPAEALRSFTLREGFHMELAACEPEVVDPVAMAFDPPTSDALQSNGKKGVRLYVVEMRDYSERRAEKLSRVRCLRDMDGDGKFETSTVFMDGLAWATAVASWHDGVFIGATPDIWYAKDTNGDGVADEKRVVFTGFGSTATKLNVQALLNSFTWDPRSHRLFGATAGNGGLVQRVIDGKPVGPAINLNGADFSFDPDKLDMRAESGTAQFGLTFDAFGNRFVCSNSAHIQWVAYDRNLLLRDGIFPPPAPLVDIAEDGPAAEVFRLSPEEPWRVVRTRWRVSGLTPGLIEGGGRSSGYFTSASGIHISSGTVGHGDAFIGDVGSNLVHRKIIRWTTAGPAAIRAPDEKDREFLASRDNWFRPVSFASGPDGALYIADMYREFIEHPDSIPPQLKKHLDLNSGNDRGRIWRIVSDAPSSLVTPGTPPKGASPNEILGGNTLDDTARLQHLANSWRLYDASPLHRKLMIACLKKGEPPGFFEAVRPNDDTASMALAAELRIRSPEDLIIKARQALTNGPEQTRLAALHCLAASNEPLSTTVHDDSQFPGVRAAAIRYSPDAVRQLLPRWKILPTLVRAAALDIMMRNGAGMKTLIVALETRDIDPAELSALHAQSLRHHSEAAWRERAAKILPPPTADRKAEIERRQPALQLKGHAEQGRPLFLQRCSSCHRDGPDGFAVGPDRASFQNKGPAALLVAILDPNREVAPQFLTAIVNAADGQTAAGILTREDQNGVTVRMPAGLEKSFARAEIKSIERPSRSLMPEGVEAGMTDQELADLFAFLISPQPK